jgi:hypothetical protein
MSEVEGSERQMDLSLAAVHVANAQHVEVYEGDVGHGHSDLAEENC